MTIQEIKEGKEFIYKGGEYKLIAHDHAIGGTTHSVIKTYGTYVGNVSKIGSKIITVYTYVLGKRVEVKMNIKDFEPLKEK